MRHTVVHHSITTTSHHIRWASIHHLMMMRHTRLYIAQLRHSPIIFCANLFDMRRQTQMFGKHSLRGDAPHHSPSPTSHRNANSRISGVCVYWDFWPWDENEKGWPRDGNEKGPFGVRSLASVFLASKWQWKCPIWGKISNVDFLASLWQWKRPIRGKISGACIYCLLKAIIRADLRNNILCLFLYPRDDNENVHSEAIYLT